MYGVATAFDFFTGLVLLTTLGLRGFAGTAGEDNLLAQAVGVVSLVMLGAAAIAAVLVARRLRWLPGILGTLLIVTGILLFLFTIFLVGLPNLALGIAVLLVRRRDVVSQPPS